MRSSLSRLFALLLVIAVGLITGYTVAKFTHAASASSSSATTTAAVVNIQLAALVWSLVTLTTGLWLLRGWIARQWSRFTARLELALDGLFDFDSYNADEVPHTRGISIQNSTVKGDVIAGRLLYRVPGSALVEMYEPTPRQETFVGQAAQVEWCAYCSGSHSDTSAREACRAQILKGVQSQPPLQANIEGRQSDGSYVIEVGPNETAVDVMKRHPDKLYTSGGDILVKRGDPVIIRRSVPTPDVLPQPGTPEYEACAQGALDDAAKTTCTACGELGHWSPDCPNLGLLPCRGCSWCGKDPGNLPAAEWTECDGSGFYLPTRAQHERINVRMQRPSPQPKQNAVVSSTPETFEAKRARLKREADARSPESDTSWPFGQCGPKPPPSTSSSNDC